MDDVSSAVKSVVNMQEASRREQAKLAEEANFVALQRLNWKMQKDKREAAERAEERERDRQFQLLQNSNLGQDLDNLSNLPPARRKVVMRLFNLSEADLTES